MENPKRKPLSKKTRFEVFKRDNFTCQYCSAKSPNVVLEVDHLLPVCKKGTNDIDNLITACFDCNRGKGKNELTSIPESVSEKLEKKRIAQSQYKEYLKLIQQRKKQEDEEVDMVEKIYNATFNDWWFSDKFRLSVKNFISKLGIESVMQAMEYSCSKIYNENKALSYFCGICWNRIYDK